MLHMFLSLSVVTLPVDCTNERFLPSSSHPETDIQSFRFSVKIFSRSVLHGSPKNYFFPGLSGLSETLIVMKVISHYFHQYSVITQAVTLCHISTPNIYIFSNATTCPFSGLRGPSSWAWQECNRLLRLGRP